MRFIMRMLAELERQGWTYRKGNCHIIAYPPDKQFHPVSISTTTSDRNGQKNYLRDLRKAGALL